MLRENKSLRSLNLESNFITSTGIQALVGALRENETLTEIKIDNQVGVGGVVAMGIGPRLDWTCLLIMSRCI